MNAGVTGAAAPRVPVTVIGGYLGAGKTTLVNHLLRNAAGLRIAVLVNDFGDLPIDEDLIEAESEDLISIAGGCVCCSFGSDLMAALMQLPLRGPPPQHVIIETSGVALPGIVARSVALICAYAIDGVVVVADAETVRARAADRYMGDTITRQLAEADLVLLNKTDLVRAGDLQELGAWMKDAAPRARTLAAHRGAVPLEVLFGTGRAFAAHEQTGLFGSGALRPLQDASAGYESASFTPERPLDVARLAGYLADPGCGLIRAKGVLRDIDRSTKTLQLVGARHEVTIASSKNITPLGLACIGLRGQLDRAAIERALQLAMPN